MSLSVGELPAPGEHEHDLRVRLQQPVHPPGVIGERHCELTVEERVIPVAEAVVQLTEIGHHRDDHPSVGATLGGPRP